MRPQARCVIPSKLSFAAGSSPAAEDGIERDPPSVRDDDLAPGAGQLEQGAELRVRRGRHAAVRMRGDRGGGLGSVVQVHFERALKNNNKRSGRSKKEVVLRVK